MARWFIVRIVGTGTTQDRYRVKVAGTAGVTSYVAQIASTATGQPLRTWALCHVEASSFTAVLADADVFALPNITKDQLLGAVTTKQRTAISQKVQAVWGFTPDTSVSVPFRALLRQIGQRDEPQFHEDNFGVR